MGVERFAKIEQRAHVKAAENKDFQKLYGQDNQLLRSASVAHIRRDDRRDDKTRLRTYAENALKRFARRPSNCAGELSQELMAEWNAITEAVRDSKHVMWSEQQRRVAEMLH